MLAMPDDIDRALPLAPPRHARTLPIIVALTAVGLLLAYVLPPALVADTAVAADGVLLPDRLDGYSLLNDTVERVPAGTALLTYGSGNWELFQTIQQVMVGVDGDSYRQLDAVYDGGHVTRSTFLAPDGRSVLVTEEFERSTAIVRVDLATGERRDIALPRAAAVVMYAWSPDGRYVAYGQSGFVGEGHASNALDLDVRTSGTLTLLDLTTGTSTPYPRLGPIAAAAFSPDSRRLVVQSARHAFVIDIDGTVEHDIAIPIEGLGIVPHVAWSPDGHWIALYRWRASIYLPDIEGPSSSYGLRDPAVVVVDATGGTASRGPFPVDTEVLGWRDADHLVTAGYVTQGYIRELSLVDGRSRELSRFVYPHTCEFFTQSCHVYKVMAASNLIPDLRVVAAGVPQRGQKQLRLMLAGSVVLIGVGALVTTLVHRSRRRRGWAARRRARSTPPQAEDSCRSWAQATVQAPVRSGR